MQNILTVTDEYENLPYVNELKLANENRDYKKIYELICEPSLKISEDHQETLKRMQEQVYFYVGK